MISYFDTSVLFPAMHTAHPDHLRCKQVFNQATAEGEIVCLSMHVYAELYANLTRFPLGRRIHPREAVNALLKLDEAVRAIDLDQQDYKEALQRCARLGLISGVVYDALHLQAAIKAQANVLFTANYADFQRLWSKELKLDLVVV